MKTATPAMARAINDRLALDLLLEHGALTAPQLREHTGLSRPTVADLLERLQAAGLVEARGEYGEDRRGPNARLYGVVAGRAHVAGVDIRRTGLTVTVADLTGATIGTATRGPSPDLAGTIAAAVREASSGRAVNTVVLGAPGVIHPHTSTIAGGNGVPGWTDSLPASVGAALDARVVLENEVNLAAIAEHREGAAKGRDDFALLWLDDGVGGAVVLDGRLRRGSSGGAGEIGLLDIDGTTFCCAIDPAQVPDLTREELTSRVASGTFAVIAVLDPGLVVLGGTKGKEGGDELADQVEKLVASRSPAVTRVRPSTVRGNAILQGAVLTALDLTRDTIFS
ncbi:ROK family transcriptional regulator [Nonomuraea sp. NPDC050556]|uniref:ROK family transcriptional regulator n=1 Tax=Nonomuraea sp. NPDC050556 TaxID=3364369 RepID=UPI0037956166